jgi:cytochrome c-type biogenesis protein CcmH
MRSAVLVVVVVIALGLAAGDAGAQQGARHVDEPQVYEIAAQLRCVVCQNLSVADSPSEMAAQMRAIVRERLAAGESPEQVRRYFVERYGEWILLEPRREGFTLLVWIVPVVAVALGLVTFAVRVKRWSRRGAGPPAPPVGRAMSERIRREMEAEQ